MMMLFTLLKGAKMLLANKKGQAMVEYGLIIALIAIVIIVALGLVAAALSGVFGDITAELNKA